MNMDNDFDGFAFLNVSFDEEDVSSHLGDLVVLRPEIGLLVDLEKEDGA